eukprot:jgi/Chlat1/3269/Chrsp22S08812
MVDRVKHWLRGMDEEGGGGGGGSSGSSSAGGDGKSSLIVSRKPKIAARKKVTSKINHQDGPHSPREDHQGSAEEELQKLRKKYADSTRSLAQQARALNALQAALDEERGMNNNNNTALKLEGAPDNPTEKLKHDRIKRLVRAHGEELLRARSESSWLQRALSAAEERARFCERRSAAVAAEATAAINEVQVAASAQLAKANAQSRAALQAAEAAKEVMEAAVDECRKERDRADKLQQLLEEQMALLRVLKGENEAQYERANAAAAERDAFAKQLQESTAELHTVKATATLQVQQDELRLATAHADVESFSRRADTAESDLAKAIASRDTMEEELKLTRAHEELRLVRVDSAAAVQGSATAISAADSAEDKAQIARNLEFTVRRLRLELEEYKTELQQEREQRQSEVKELARMRESLAEAQQQASHMLADVDKRDDEQQMLQAAIDAQEQAQRMCDQLLREAAVTRAVLLAAYKRLRQLPSSPHTKSEGNLPLLEHLLDALECEREELLAEVEQLQSENSAAAEAVHAQSGLLSHLEAQTKDLKHELRHIDSLCTTDPLHNLHDAIPLTSDNGADSRMERSREGRGESTARMAHDDERDAVSWKLKEAEQEQFRLKDSIRQAQQRMEQGVKRWAQLEEEVSELLAERQGS